MNKKGEATHFPHDTNKTPSVIDLTWVNHEATGTDIIQEWRIDPEMAYNSDHAHKYNFSEVDPKEWMDQYCEGLKAHKDKISILSTKSQVLTNNELEDATTAITEAMKAATATVAEERRSSPHAKPWWNNRISEAVGRVKRARASAREHRMTNGLTDLSLQAAVRHEERHTEHLIQYTKKTWAVDQLEGAVPKDIWGFRKWSAGTRNFPTPAIRRADDEYNINLTDDLPDDLEFADITDEEVAEAVADMSNSYAPGESQQSYQQVKWAL
ncbi:hypothetical protein AAF712_015786 [Marasmius tenuissimus]|uniref:Polyprotein n=1 Tax=Marasmius tenuissimus TaxID=585030 RepID=A0ABR2Z995_9AGAR